MSDTLQEACTFPFDNIKFDRRFLKPDVLNSLGIRSAALIETLLFLSFVVLFNILTGDGNRYLGASLHPFWIIILLVTVQYGLKESLVAALLASTFLLAGNLPEQNMSEGVYEYILRVFSQPLMWFVAATILGGIRERQLSEKEELIHGLKRFEDAMSVIVEGYKSLKHSKEQLEIRLSEESCSLLSMYEIARSLETLEATEAMSAAENLVRLTLKPMKFSLYQLKGEALCLKAAYGWDECDDYEKLLDEKNPITISVVTKKQILSVANRKQEKLLAGQGLIAGPIFDQNNEKVLGMLKIEDSSFTNMGIRTHETFRIVCAWIARIAVNIDKYQVAVNRDVRSDVLETPYVADFIAHNAPYKNGAAAQSLV